MIRGLVYLTGLVTLGIVGLVAAFAYDVHTWPWRDYVHEGREFLAETLEPEGDPPRGDEAPSTGAPGPDAAGAQGAEGAREDDPDGDLAGKQESTPAPEREAVPLRHVVETGDTLYALAGRYYGNPMRWQAIARANDIRKPADLRPGRVLLILPDARKRHAAGGTPRDEGRPFIDMSLALWPASAARRTGGEEDGTE